MTALISVCVFCGSRPGGAVEYVQAARNLGDYIVARGWRLVYGAGGRGMMGAVAEAVVQGEGHAMGVIPPNLMKKESARRDLTQLVITSNMHERKQVMFMNSDIIVVLPGGIGTLDEFFEVLTWAQIGLHEKPIILLNINNYWQPVIALLQHIIAHQFAEDNILKHITLADSTTQLEGLLEQLAAKIAAQTA